MRKMMKLAVLAMPAVLLVSPALAKKAPVERTVVDGITLALVKQHTQLPPYYPATARTSKPSAEVVMAVEVDEKGKVSGVEVLSSSVEGLGFDVSATAAVKQWRFHPALQDGAAIDSVSVIRLNFAPPTLRSPEGFVFTEVSPRFFAGGMFDPVQGGRELNQARAFVNPFLVDQFANHDPRATIRTSDLPPCPAGRNSGLCMYDRSDMQQFGGAPSVIHAPPTPGVR